MIVTFRLTAKPLTTWSGNSFGLTQIIDPSYINILAGTTYPLVVLSGPSGRGVGVGPASASSVSDTWEFTVDMPRFPSWVEVDASTLGIPGVALILEVNEPVEGWRTIYRATHGSATSWLKRDTYLPAGVYDVTDNVRIKRNASINASGVLVLGAVVSGFRSGSPAGAWLVEGPNGREICEHRPSMPRITRWIDGDSFDYGTEWLGLTATFIATEKPYGTNLFAPQAIPAFSETQEIEWANSQYAKSGVTSMELRPVYGPPDGANYRAFGLSTHQRGIVLDADCLLFSFLPGGSSANLELHQRFVQVVMNGTGGAGSSTEIFQSGTGKTFQLAVPMDSPGDYGVTVSGLVPGTHYYGVARVRERYFPVDRFCEFASNLL